MFNEQAILLNLAGSTKDAVFTELIEALTAVHPEFDRDELRAVIDERERKMSAGVGGGAAIPHGYYQKTSCAAGALGVSKTGIDYGALDDKPVYIVFITIIGGASRENHLRILNQISALINSEALNLIRTAKNSREALDILSRFY
ncbi:MAG: PTS sugar transporter subunit IIA [Treponema sp.]|nr:PTS sugar transporter subunit IIA [Treponema sp.]